MKTNKFYVLTAVIVLVIAISAVMSGCVAKNDTQIDDALALISQNNYLKVEVSDANGVFYVYDNGQITDIYNLGIKFEDAVKEGGEKFTLTESNLKDGYKCNKDTVSGNISLEAELVKTEALGGIDGAKLVLEANTVTKKIKTCTVSYIDANGFNVKITLA